MTEREAAKDRWRAQTFAAVAERFLEASLLELQTPGALRQWRRSLRELAGPFRDKPISEIVADDVAATLAPFWRTKPALAAKVRLHWERVFSWFAEAEGKTEAFSNPAAWTPYLRSQVQPDARRSHARRWFQDLPAMIADLERRSGEARLALELCVRLVAPHASVCGLKWSQLSCTTDGQWVLIAPPKAGWRRGERSYRRRPLDERLLTSLQARGHHQSDARATATWIFSSSQSEDGLSEVTMRRFAQQVFGDRASRLDWPWVEDAFMAWVASDSKVSAPRDVGDGGDIESLALAPDALQRLFAEWNTFLDGDRSDA